MAITRRNPTGAMELYGLSGDTKPTTFGVGSVFYESNTGIAYRWSGSVWFPLSPGGGVAGTPNPAVQTVQGIIGGTPIPVDGGSPVLAAAADALGVDTLFDASVTNAAEVLKASAGAIYGGRFVNNHATTAVWIVLFNVAAASVVLGTTVPKDFIYLPGGAVDSIHPSAMAISYGTAMSYACVSTLLGAGAPAAAASVEFYFK